MNLTSQLGVRLIMNLLGALAHGGQIGATAADQRP